MAAEVVEEIASTSVDSGNSSIVLSPDPKKSEPSTVVASGVMETKGVLLLTAPVTDIAVATEVAIEL